MKDIDCLKTPRLLPWHWRRPITTQEAWRSCYAFPKSPDAEGLCGPEMPLDDLIARSIRGAFTAGVQILNQFIPCSR